MSCGSSELVKKEDPWSSGVCSGMCGILGVITCFHSQSLALNIAQFKYGKESFNILRSYTHIPSTMELMKKMSLMFEFIFCYSNRQLLLSCKTMRACGVKMFSWSLTFSGLKVRCQKSKINMTSESVQGWIWADF